MMISTIFFLSLLFVLRCTSSFVRGLVWAQFIGDTFGLQNEFIRASRYDEDCEPKGSDFLLTTHKYFVMYIIINIFGHFAVVTPHRTYNTIFSQFLALVCSVGAFIYSTLCPFILLSEDDLLRQFHSWECEVYFMWPQVHSHHKTFV